MAGKVCQAQNPSFGRCMSWPRVKEYSNLIRVNVNAKCIQEIFDTGSSDFITLHSCLDNQLYFFHMSLGTKSV